MILKSREQYYIVFMYNYYQLTLFLVLSGDQKSNFQPWLVWTRPYKSRAGTERGENGIFKNREWYYI